MPQDALEGQRWIVVADSPFLPAHGGGEVEHLGFVRACVDAGVLAALVVPADADPGAVGRDDDIAGIRALVAPAPVFLTPRRRTVGSVVQGIRPYPVASRPAPPGLSRDLHATVPDATGVVAFSYRSHRVAAAIAQALGLPAVLRMHNMESRYFHALAKAKTGPTKWAVHAEATRIDADERRLEASSWVTGIADISASDARERAARTTKPVAYVPTFALAGRPVDLSTTWQPEGDPTVLFLGALDVPTNHDAVAWLCRKVWPAVRASVPQARLEVVGRRPTADMRELVAATPGAELHADVPDPRWYMSRASVAVNPAITGSGVNIKLVEYLGTGVPVVTTTLGAQGLALRSEHDALIRDEPGAFAEAVRTLLTDPTRAAEVGARGRETSQRLIDVRSSLVTISELMTGRALTSDRQTRGELA